MPTWLGLRSTSCQKQVSPLFFHRCLLDRAYKSDCRKRVSPFLQIGAYFIGLMIHKLPKTGLTLFHFSFLHLDLTLTVNSFKFLFFLSFGLTSIANSSNFHFLSGLTSDCQFFDFSSFFYYLDLPLISSSFHPLFYLPGLTSECQFDCVLTLSLMFTWLDLHLRCQFVGIETNWKSLILTKLPSFVRRSFWSFYRVQDPLSSCIPILDMNTYIWCNVSCNVWLCMNEMSEHLNLFHSFFIFLVSSKMWNATVMPQLCRWNTMIGLTNVICKYCALICYW